MGALRFYDPNKCRLAIARVSGCALTIAPNPKEEIDFQINRAMKRLFDEGCRRIIGAKRLPITGDGEAYLLRGWLP